MRHEHVERKRETGTDSFLFFLSDVHSHTSIQNLQRDYIAQRRNLTAAAVVEKGLEVAVAVAVVGSEAETA